MHGWPYKKMGRGERNFYEHSVMRQQADTVVHGGAGDGFAGPER